MSLTGFLQPLLIASIDIRLTFWLRLFGQSFYDAAICPSKRVKPHSTTTYSHPRTRSNYFMEISLSTNLLISMLSAEGAAILERQVQHG